MAPEAGAWRGPQRHYPEPPRADPKAARALARASRAVLPARDLRAFVRTFWPILEPKTPLTWGRHLDLLCDVLQAITEERYFAPDDALRQLVICVPPGHMKSLLVAVFWPAWMWLTDPTKRILCVTNSDGLGNRDSRRTRALVESEPYRELVALVETAAGRNPWSLAADSNQITKFDTDRTGFRQVLTIGANVTGARGDVQIIDDPVDAKAATIGTIAQITARMNETRETDAGTLSTRLNPGGVRVLIAQRLHPLDLPAAWMEAGSRSIVLPAEYDPSIACREDWRTRPGELLFPALFDAASLAVTRKKLGRYAAAQLDQRPTELSGSIYLRDWMQTYSHDPRVTPNVEEVLVSVDAAFRGTDTSDYVVAQVWARARGRFYLLDQIRARMTYTQTKTALRALVVKWPTVRTVLIEAKANGDALIDDLRNELPNVVAVDPKLSKVARAQLAATSFEALSVFLPASAPWLSDYIEEHCAFPGSANDDQVDATSQALDRLVGRQQVTAAVDQYAFLLNAG